MNTIPESYLIYIWVVIPHIRIPVLIFEINLVSKSFLVSPCNLSSKLSMVLVSLYYFRLVKWIQKLTILCSTTFSRLDLPSSPYAIVCCWLIDSQQIFQKLLWKVSIASLPKLFANFWKSQTSQPYSKIITIILSNISHFISTGKFNFKGFLLHYTKHVYTGLLAWQLLY